ncbi:uncharacterized protein BP5553_05855 [Venustampulla echinocandica]|uniref:C2H2-type domain-containing protein n=1 Tax=Venustampulla echinocandica TaxID=2656787 RepID=A0A370TLV4_9HELO|nr:uncharacterized protein BP5553_05855 [Venustampulla echinocandica]RDL36503.1 hypothetical protein BP5553_05855 [Venustampulla echinocandica]
MPSSSSSVAIIAVRKVVRPTEIERPSPFTFQRRLERLPFAPFDDSRVATWLRSLTERANLAQLCASTNFEGDDEGRQSGDGEVMNHEYGGQEHHEAQANDNRELTVTRERSLSAPSSYKIANALRDPSWTWESTGFYPQSPTHSGQPGASTNRCNASPPPAQPEPVGTNGFQDRQNIDEDAFVYYPEGDWVYGQYRGSGLSDRAGRDEEKGGGEGEGEGDNCLNRKYYFIASVGDGDDLDEDDLRYHGYHIPGVDDRLNGSLEHGSDFDGPDAPAGANTMLPIFRGGSQYTQNVLGGRTSRPDGSQGKNEGHALVQGLSERSLYSPSLLRNSNTPRADSHLAVVITSPPAQGQSQTLHSSAGSLNQSGGLQAQKDAGNKRFSTSRIVPPPRDNRSSRMTVPSKQSSTNQVEMLGSSLGYTSNEPSSAPRIGRPSERPNTCAIESIFSSKNPLALPNQGDRLFSTPQTTVKAAGSPSSSFIVPKKRGRPFSTPQTAAKGVGHPSTSRIVPKKRGRPFSSPQAAEKAAVKAAARAVERGSASTSQIKKRKRQAGTSVVDSSNGEPKKRARPLEGYRPAPVEARYAPFICQWKGCLAELHNLETLRAHIYGMHCYGREAGMTCGWGKCGDSDGVGKELNVRGVKRHFAFTFIDDLKDHIEEAHLVPFAWHMGDGPKTPSLTGTLKSRSTISEPWLYDAGGRQVTPSVRCQRVEGGDPRFNNFRRFQKQVRGGVYSVSRAANPSINPTSTKAANNKKPHATWGMNTMNNKPSSDGVMVLLPPVKSPQDYQKVPFVISDDEDELALNNAQRRSGRQ